MRIRSPQVKLWLGKRQKKKSSSGTMLTSQSIKKRPQRMYSTQGLQLDASPFSGVRCAALVVQEEHHEEAFTEDIFENSVDTSEKNPEATPARKINLV